MSGAVIGVLVFLMALAISFFTGGSTTKSTVTG